jgi:hypothetical protein
VSWLSDTYLQGKIDKLPSIVRRFTTADAAISHDLVIDGDAWSWRSGPSQLLPLFEVADPTMEQCELIFRATLRCESPAGLARLELWCRSMEGSQTCVRNADQAPSGMVDWTVCEVSLRLGKGQRAESVTLQVLAEGAGRAWIKDVELLRTPL